MEVPFLSPPHPSKVEIPHHQCSFLWRERRERERERDGGGEWYALDSVYMIHVANVPHLIEHHICRDKREPDVNIGDHITSCDVEFLHYKLLLLIK